MVQMHFLDKGAATFEDLFICAKGLFIAAMVDGSALVRQFHVGRCLPWSPDSSSSSNAPTADHMIWQFCLGGMRCPCCQEQRNSFR
jgi:hypothetical protein